MWNLTFSFVFFFVFVPFDSVGVYQSYLLIVRSTYDRAGLWEGTGLSAHVKGDLVNERP